jgi:large conductance mechanosensitive channel
VIGEKRVLKGFRDFVMRGNVVDLAVGIVIGAAFTAVVTSFVDSFIKPLIQLIPAIGTKGGVTIQDNSGTAEDVILKYGDFIAALINFLAVAAVIYFLVVLPMNKLAERRKRGEVPEPAAPSEDIVLLTEIRDALRSRPLQGDTTPR